MFNDEQPFSFYDKGYKTPVLTFKEGDGPTRPTRIYEWLREITTVLNDRAVKFHPKSPMIGLVDKTPMLWGPAPNALGPSFSGDCGIP